MKLTFAERLRMGFLLPQMEDMLVLEIADGIKQKIKLSAEEMTEVDYKRLPDGNSWFDDKKEPPPKDIKFNNIEISFLKQELEKKHTAKQIPAECFSLSQRIRKLELKQEPKLITAKKRK